MNGKSTSWKKTGEVIIYTIIVPVVGLWTIFNIVMPRNLMEGCMYLGVLGFYIGFVFYAIHTSIMIVRQKKLLTEE